MPNTTVIRNSEIPKLKFDCAQTRKLCAAYGTHRYCSIAISHTVVVNCHVAWNWTLAINNVYDMIIQPIIVVAVYSE